MLECELLLTQAEWWPAGWNELEVENVLTKCLLGSWGTDRALFYVRIIVTGSGAVAPC